jgi:hypothetical protein
VKFQLCRFAGNLEVSAVSVPQGSFVAGPTADQEVPMARSRSVDDRSRWQGACRSRFAVPTFLLLMVAGLVVAVALGGSGGALAGLALTAAGLLVMTLVAIRVTVTDRALVVEYSGPLRWPTMTMSLDDVVTFEAIDVRPMRYGGWGYRGSLRLFRRAALVLRRGPGLRLQLRDGRVFVVTVDDPDGAVVAAAASLSGGRR